MAQLLNGSSRLAALERALLQLERKLPLLRKHVAEHAQLPTPLHYQQLVATLELMAQAMVDLHPGERQPTV